MRMVKFTKKDVIEAYVKARAEAQQAQPASKPSLADQIEGIVSRAPRPEIQRRPEPIPPESPE